MMYARPDLMHRILAINADAVAAYLNAQIEAGAQAVMVFDSWGGVLADGAFQRFSLAYTERVLEQLKKERGLSHPAHRLHQGRRACGSSRSPPAARRGRPRLDGEPGPGARARRRPRGVAGQPRPQRAVRAAGGDPAEVAKALESFGPPAAGAGHVFNLGHGISQFTPPEHVSVLVDAVHEYSRRAVSVPALSDLNAFRETRAGLPLVPHRTGCVSSYLSPFAASPVHRLRLLRRKRRLNACAKSLIHMGLTDAREMPASRSQAVIKQLAA